MAMRDAGNAWSATIQFMSTSLLPPSTDAHATAAVPAPPSVASIEPASQWVDFEDVADLQAAERARESEAWERPPHY